MNSTDEAKLWAEKLEKAEAAAFEKALKRAKDMQPVQYIKTENYPNEVNDEVEWILNLMSYTSTKDS